MKRKLVAALLSVAMVASITPTTPFTAAATVEAAETESEAVKTAKEAIIRAVKETGDTTINYAGSGKLLEAATAAYNNVPADERPALEALYERLDAANTLYKAYTDKIAEVEAAYAAVKTINYGDSTNSTTALYKVRHLTDSVATDSKTVNSARITAEELSQNDLWASVSAATVSKRDDVNAAASAVNTINNAVATITSTNYKAVPSPTQTATDTYNALTAAQKELVGNYGSIVGMDNDIAAYKKAVKDLEELNTEDYRAAVAGGNSLTAKNIDKATEAVAAVKKAFEALKEDVQTAVTNDATVSSVEISSANIKEAEKNIKAYNDGVAAAKEAEPVIAKIRALKAPASIGLADGAAIAEARAAYDALSAAAKGCVSNSSIDGVSQDYYAVLIAAENAYAAVVSAQTTEERVTKMKAMVNALPDVNSITLADEAAVEEARLYFNTNPTGNDLDIEANGEFNKNWTAHDWQKIFVLASADKTIANASEADYTAEYLKLKGCIQVLNKLQTEELANANKYIDTYLKTGTGKLANYADGKDSAYIGTNAEKLANAKTILEKAKADLAKLTAREQKLVEQATNYGWIKATEEAIAKAEKAIADAATVKEIEKLIDAIGITSAQVANINDVITADTLSKYESAVEAANKAYTAANKDVKAALSTAKVQILTAAADRVKELKDSTSIASIEATIASVPVVKTDGTETEATLSAAQKQLKDAQALFDGLSANVQKKISNAGRLATAQKALNEAATKLINAEFAKIGNVTTGITDAQIAQFDKVNALLKEFGLEKGAVTETNPTYDQVKGALDKKEATALKTVKDGINALPSTVTKNDVKAIYELQKTYESLSAESKKAITDAQLAKLQKAIAEADALSLSKATVTIEDQTYTGEDIMPTVVVKDAAGKVVDAAAYKVTYTNNVDAGTATATVAATADGAYVGSVEVNFTIKPADLSAATVSGATKTYTGKAVTTTTKVVVGGKTLTAETDYDVVSYADNKNIGTAKVTVTGKGNYTGTATGTFVIKPAKANLTKVTAGKKKATAKYTGQTGASYKVVYAVKGTTKYKAVYSKNLTKTISGLKSGTTYKVKVLAYYKDANGKAYYTGYSNMRTVKVK